MAINLLILLVSLHQSTSEFESHNYVLGAQTLQINVTDPSFTDKICLVWTYKCVCETELWRLIICISGDIDVRGPVEPVFTNNRYMRSMGIQSRKKDFVKLIIIVLLPGKQHDYLESWRTSIGVLLLVLVVEQSLIWLSP